MKHKKPGIFPFSFVLTTCTGRRAGLGGGGQVSADPVVCISGASQRLGTFLVSAGVVLSPAFQSGSGGNRGWAQLLPLVRAIAPSRILMFALTPINEDVKTWQLGVFRVSACSEGCFTHGWGQQQGIALS